ncbi:MAG TPA: ABC transporter ATP-binding protein [Candidatus Limnocylindrales bacterium]|nr:ABC transporter ATP-binding protein [Candidatus Limnocylindrales bacterium]
MSRPAISVDRLVKRYDDRAVVDGASLKVEAGQVVALLGPNGAGKTTTVEVVEGYRSADGGTVRVLGEDPWEAGRDLRARVGLMLQAGGFDIRARPLETLRQYASFHADAADPDELIDLVGLGKVARTPYRRLSGGERQRLALAVALVGQPEVLILDEPTAGMDPEARAATRSIIHDQRAAGAAILLTSHDLVDVERLADRIAIIVAGRVVAAGTAAELASGLHPRVRFRLDRFLTDADVVALSNAIEGRVQTIEPGRYEIDGVAPSPMLLAALAAWCAANGRLVVESTTVGGSLEDAYLALVEDAR